MTDLSKIRIPHRDPIPAWYKLSVKGEGTLVITIHKNPFEFFVSQDHASLPIVRHMLEEFHFDDFIAFNEISSGFGTKTLWGPDGVLERMNSEDPDWVRLECTLPNFRDYGDHRKFTRVRATLMFLFQALGFYVFDNDSGYSKPQLMTIDTMRLAHELHGGSLTATLTPAMMHYLHSQPDQSSLVPVADAMRAVSHYMLSKPKWSDKYDYRVICRQPKWISLHVPGNACDLYPSSMYEKSLDVGYELSPHNVDSGFQQLAFMFGLAKLHELAEQDNP